MGISFRSGIDTAAPGHQWLWRNRLVANTVNLVDGRKGSGKSTLVRGILGCWKAGKMPDATPPHRKLRRVMWFTSEEDYDNTVAPALKLEGIPDSDVITIDRRNKLAYQRLDLFTSYTQIAEEIMDKKIDAVVVDPFSELKPVGYATKDDGAMREYMTMMLSLASSTLSTWIVLRHLRKAKSTFALDEGAGSVQIAACARSVTRCDWPDRMKPERYYGVLVCNLGEPVNPLQFRCISSASKIPVVQWKGVTKLSMEEIIELNAEDSTRSVLDQAKEIIKCCIEEGNNTAVAILKEAKLSDISGKTMHKAKDQMKVTAQRVVDPVSGVACWMWVPPPKIVDKKERELG